MPTVEELELRVATSAQDASLALRLGAFTLKAVAAVEALCGELGVAGVLWSRGAPQWEKGRCPTGQCAAAGEPCKRRCFLPSLVHLYLYLLLSFTFIFTFYSRSLPVPADKLGPLPREVVGMLSEGRWCSTAVHWTVAVAERLKAAQQGGAAQAAQAAQHDSSADGGVHQAAQHDATNALLLVRAAVAALALVADVGFEAAVRHLCGEYYAVAAKVRPWPAVWGAVPGVCHG